MFFFITCGVVVSKHASAKSFVSTFIALQKENHCWGTDRDVFGVGRNVLKFPGSIVYPESYSHSAPSPTSLTADDHALPVAGVSLCPRRPVPSLAQDPWGERDLALKSRLGQQFGRQGQNVMEAGLRKTCFLHVLPQNSSDVTSFFFL
ncbi:hypothetical protein BaRGS_00008672 [Batillaria attramentaria]|uniref:Uncharacterized protein n=1 Tax=Batillaria attramentaria TaxID=370345 RepID=A0ABD0LKZ2_9CAEN